MMDMSNREIEQLIQRAFDGDLPDAEAAGVDGAVGNKWLIQAKRAFGQGGNCAESSCFKSGRSGRSSDPCTSFAGWRWRRLLDKAGAV